MTIVAVRTKTGWVGLDLTLSNRLVGMDFDSGLFLRHGLKNVLRKEPAIERIRLDFEIAAVSRSCFVEVKSATVMHAGVARYPDSISPRSLRQFSLLRRIAKRGDRAVLIFLIQRGDVEGFQLNAACDPQFSTSLRRSVACGVEVMAVKHPVSSLGIGHPEFLTVDLR